MSSIPLDELDEAGVLLVYSLQIHVFHSSARVCRSGCFTNVQSTAPCLPSLRKSWTKRVFYQSIVYSSMSSISLEELHKVDILLIYSLQLHIFDPSGKAGRSWCFAIVYSSMSSIPPEELDKADILL